MQLAPLRPQAVVALPARHWPVLSQQPAQFEGAQVTEPPPPPPEPDTQAPEEEQVCELKHCEQLAPLRPQAVVAFPVRHWPVPSQQPAQLAGEQVTEPPPPPPVAPPPEPPPEPPPAPPPEVLWMMQMPTVQACELAQG